VVSSDLRHLQIFFHIVKICLGLGFDSKMSQ
jgi:hypothetical protein